MKNKKRKRMLFILLLLLFPVWFTVFANIKNRSNGEIFHDSGREVWIFENGCQMKTDMEDFILCVLMKQLAADSPKELLKAQSVVVRTYILKKMNGRTSISSKELKLPFITFSKMKEQWFLEYKKEEADTLGGWLANAFGIGKNRVFENKIEHLKDITDGTGGAVMKDDGELILPLFHGMSNGNTRSGKDCIGANYEYLKKVVCNNVENEMIIEEKTFDLQALKQKLIQNGIVVYQGGKDLFADEKIGINEVVQMTEITQDDDGYVFSVKIGDTLIEGESFATALGLRSVSFLMSVENNQLKFTTKGIGHGFGMDLTHATMLAKNKMDWKNILKTYYDVTI